MNHRWAPNILVRIDRASLMCQTHCRRSAGFLLWFGSFHCRINGQHPTGYLSLRHFHHLKLKGRRGWLFKAIQVRQRLGLHTSSPCLNTSTSRWSAGLGQQMSRVRSTLDTVSKAVSGTQTELLSKISRLKPKAQKQSQVSVESAEEKTITPTHSPTASTKTPTPTPLAASAQLAVTPALAPVPNKKLKRISPAVRPSSTKKPEELPAPPNNIGNKTTTSKESPGLFHPSTLSANLDETYSYLSHHINSYFGSFAKTQDKKDDGVDNNPPQRPTDLVPVSQKDEPSASVTPPSKKSLGQYLSYSALVGNYIAPLVPKFRGGESKSSMMEEEKKPDGVMVKQVEGPKRKEQSAAEEKAKKLLLQREKIIARVSVDNRTRALVQALHRASDVRVYISRVEDLSYHLLEFPETRGVAVKEKVIPRLLRLEQANDPGLRAAVREALALVGYHKPVKGRGIRILSIDGGGLRGVLALQTLEKLEALTGKPIYKLFDYICGVSTGAVIGFMLGVIQIPVKDCDDLYRKLGSDVFKQNVILGTVKMGWSHAFYDSEAWENILKEKVGSHLLVETSRNPECPKVAAVSTIVNQGLPLKAHIFRNYNLLPGVRSHYLGGCQHQLWQAIRATSAAPGYFQEFKLGNDLHQDGGLLINNPTALAIHECKCLWPDTPLECVVSLGTGRIETAGKTSATYTSLKTKLTNVISSATDTEEVHAMLDAFLPPNTYFRFNPFLNKEISMDESRLEKLNMLQAEGIRYLERNEEKLKKVARLLTREKSSVQRVKEWARLRADMYNGLTSKL
ncbi:calcium-independent phospholipase A2-gamma-like [Cyprinodon tularosa]|uniref:calcium-independent phospholipase A2-gamma-like n=1 Tax=Cyprinodon tularosa TaxID=77115 RepID=UPI0018E27357|nr:calcium-independent phospholipase A2-gamma-like [Cyprinodon tularosa]XP_038164841.1 calcium-independent phospholipase A2-gamma-like [Cyprinodon tularosa]XP_038164842.1 calcium-independent phospholipase A2-gamma-like [Cyprinodon tularosa]